MRRHRGWLLAAVVLATALAVAAVGVGYHHYAYVWRKTHEPPTDATETSANPVYTDDEFRDTLEAYGFDEYFDLDQVVTDSYVLPGLYSTRTMKGNKDLATCTSMVPQGVCVAEREELEDYLGAEDDADRPDIDGDTIVPVDASLIDGEIQGFTIDEDFAATSQSSGPGNSTVYLFQNTGNISDVLRTSDNAIETYTMPPMLEEIATDEGGGDGGKAYLCFESGAYAYRARLNAKIDRIVVLDEGAD